MLEVIEPPTKEELLKEWTIEVANKLYKEKKLTGILKVDEFVKSKLPIYTFFADREEGKYVRKWIKKELLTYQKFLNMMNKDEVVLSNFTDFDKMFRW